MSVGAIWAYFITHKNAWWQLVLGVVLFATGFQLGKVASPYYASHPIIFEDRECSECSSSGGTATELEQLKQEGIAQRKPVPAVAGQQSDARPSDAATQKALQSPGQGRFVGSVNSNKYHAVPECSTWKQIKEANQIWFTSREEAEAAGYVPTKCTAEVL